MQLSRLFLLVTSAILPVALLASTWLYLYPIFHGCHFPVPERSRVFNPTKPEALKSALKPLPQQAPFRLLAFGDPQLEGDSSLPDPFAPVFPSLRYVKQDLTQADTWHSRRAILRNAITDVFTTDIPRCFKGYRKRLDLWGNDLYLAHIVRSLRWWTAPSHVAVLGDLLGSQWIADAEFVRRADRYWSTVFRGMEKVPGPTMDDNEEEGRRYGGTVEVLGTDKRWENRLINIAGNHDVGYAGDLTERRMERFEDAFGRANWEIVFTLNNTSTRADEDTRETEEESGNDLDTQPPALRLVILNSMNLDTPARSEALQAETYAFLNHIISTSRPVTDKTHATLLLTHIPLHKEAGICVDAPFFDFFASGSGVKEQNMLSAHASKMLLEGVFGLSGDPRVEGQGFGRRGIIINGHDHAGCDVVHYISKSDAPCPLDVMSDGSLGEKTPEWRAFPSNTCRPDDDIPTIREITLRSMMGEFSGYAGFLSAWFEESLGEKGEWRLEFTTCGMGVQHWWWVVHVVDIIAVLLVIVTLVVTAVERLSSRKDSPAPRAKVRDTASKGEIREKERDVKSAVTKNAH